MGSIDRKKLIKIGVNGNSRMVEGSDYLSTVTATLLLNLDEEKLILDVMRKWKNKDGKPLISHIGYFHVGTLQKPNKRAIAKVLKDNKQIHSFSLTGWHNDEYYSVTLNDILLNITEGSNKISRTLKLKQIKKKLKDG